MRYKTTFYLSFLFKSTQDNFFFNVSLLSICTTVFLTQLVLFSFFKIKCFLKDINIKFWINKSPIQSFMKLFSTSLRSISGYCWFLQLVSSSPVSMGSVGWNTFLVAQEKCARVFPLSVFWGFLLLTQLWKIKGSATKNLIFYSSFLTLL